MPQQVCRLCAPCFRVVAYSAKLKNHHPHRRQAQTKKFPQIKFLAQKDPGQEGDLDQHGVVDHARFGVR